jgi:prepilin-type N-terminal cleavage/methylation domain-containing protein
MRNNSSCGFTLIELMVVLAIAALGIAMVSPNMIRVYENFKVSAEERKLAELLASVRMKAFFRNTAFVVKLEENTFKVMKKGAMVQFEHITFPPQQFTVNEHGFSDQPRTQYHLSNQPDIRTIENNPGAL